MTIPFVCGMVVLFAAVFTLVDVALEAARNRKHVELGRLAMKRMRERE